MQQRRRLAFHREQKWPNLHQNPARYEVTSDEDRYYNCAAWAVNVNDARWWPIPGRPEYYWPPNARRDDSLQAFVEGYGEFGYQVCEDGDFEDGFEKIVVYASDDGEPLHVAKQLSNGRWTSKLGELEDIEHSTPEDLTSDGYGSPRLFLRRQIQLPPGPA